MTKYDSGKIYKLIDTRDHSLLYIGSTCMSLCKRLWYHVSASIKKPAPIHIYINNEIQNWDLVTIELVENFPCNSKNELLQREQQYINELKPTHNTIKAFLSIREKKEYDKEYKQQDEYKIKKKEWDKEYRESNKEQLSQKYKDRYIENCDAVKTRVQKYYNDNKNIISEKLKVKVHCDVCNCDVRKAGFKRHEKSKVHISFLQQNQ